MEKATDPQSVNNNGKTVSSLAYTKAGKPGAWNETIDNRQQTKTGGDAQGSKEIVRKQNVVLASTVETFNAKNADTQLLEIIERVGQIVISKSGSPVTGNADEETKTSYDSTRSEMDDLSMALNRMKITETGSINKKEIKIACWNVNGIRSKIYSNELKNYLDKYDPDIFCINETKLPPSKENEESQEEKYARIYSNKFPQYNKIFLNNNNKEYKKFDKSDKKYHYHGTGIFTKIMPVKIEKGKIGVETYDDEGRLIVAEFENFALVVVYAPLATDKFEQSRIELWDPKFYQFIKKLLESKQNVIVVGDFNVLNETFDLNQDNNYVKRQSDLDKLSTFKPKLRENFKKLLDLGLTDTFRKFKPKEIQFTTKTGRLDYILVSTSFMPAIKTSEIIKLEEGKADHCPIEVILDPNWKPASNWN